MPESTIEAVSMYCSAVIFEKCTEKSIEEMISLAGMIFFKTSYPVTLQLIVGAANVKKKYFLLFLRLKQNKEAYKKPKGTKKSIF